MRTQVLGRSSLVSTRIAYGCLRVAGGVFNPSRVTPQMQAEGVAAIRAAYECGINHFDVADVYCQGFCERILGQALAEIGGMRERVIITSKVGIRIPGQPLPASPHRYDFSSEHILASCDGSLWRLGVEQIDLYLLHRPDMLMNPHEIATAFDKLQQAGKVRQFGVSNHKPSLISMLQKWLPTALVCNQIQINPARIDCMYDGTLDQCLEMTITPTAWSPIAQGLFADGGQPAAQDPRREGLAKLLEVVDDVATTRGVSRQVATLAWLMRHPAGIIPIIGANMPQQIREMARADDLELTRDEWYRIFVAARMKPLP
jgi:predicted oxidoreductase